MTDYELSQFCARNPDCGCNCMKCPAFAANINKELGLNDYDNEEDFDN